MTCEAARALEIIKLGKKYKEDIKNIKKEHPLIDPENPKSVVNISTHKLWEPYIQRYSKQGMILFEHCKEHSYIKTEFEEEERNLEAKIWVEKEKYFKENKAKIDGIKKSVSAAKKCEAKRKKAKNVVNVIMSALIGLWIAAYIVLLIVLPTDSTVHRLMIEGVLLFGAVPFVGLVLLRILVNKKVESWAASATRVRTALEKEYEQEKKKADDKVAHLTERLNECKLIIGIITDRRMPVI